MAVLPWVFFFVCFVYLVYFGQDSYNVLREGFSRFREHVLAQSITSPAT